MLGETSETKSINVDQPVPVETSEPIPFAEIDTTIFDDEPAVEERPSRPAVTNEFASPIFAKRSRASYGPLFELDLDDELEEDGGRREKGRKRPRYSVQNRMWRYREDSSSPEPEASQNSPFVSSPQNGDVEMEDTPAKPNMMDGGCQTNESELAPHPSTSVHTPVKGWNMARTLPSFGVGSPQPPDAARFNAGVQASPPGFVNSLSDEGHGAQAPQTTPNPFGLMSNNSTGFPQIEGSAHPGFGMPQGPTTSTSQGFPQSSSLFGSPPNPTSHQLNREFGQASTLFGTAPTGQSSHVIGRNYQPFGTGPAPTPSALFQAANAKSDFGVTGGSSRFGLGQEPQSAFGTSPFTATQPSAHQSNPDPYPESYLDRNETTHHAPPAPQNPFGGFTQDGEYRHGFMANDIHEHTSGNIAGRESYENGPQSTPPGMVFPRVEDGTRNTDEMQREGLLSNSVYRQGVPPGALAGGEDASAREDFVGSDDQAYDESEKGDDYDLRNYGGVSDDEQDFGEQRPLPDDELMDEDEEPLEGEDEDFDEDDYEEEDYEDEHHENHPPPQSQIRQEPIVIDLLSDSDDDEPPPAVQAPRNQTQQQHSGNLVQNETEKGGVEHLNQGSRPYLAPQPPQEDASSQQDEQDQEEVESPERMMGHFDDDTDGSLSQDEDASGDFEGSEAEYVEPEYYGLDGHGPEGEDILVRDASPAIGTVNGVAGMEEAIAVTFERTHEVESNNEVIIEEEVHTEIIAVSKKNVIQQQTDGADGADDAMDLDQERHGDLVESFQSQPTEMLASFQTHTTTPTNHASSSTSGDAAHEDVNDNLAHEEVRAEANKEDHPRAYQSDAAGESSMNDPTSKSPEDVIETFDEDSDENVDDETGETGEVISAEDSWPEQVVDSDEQGNVPPSPPESQDPEVDMEPKINISMTTVTSHVESQLSYQHYTASGTQETEVMSTQDAGNTVDHMDIVQEKDNEMVDAGTLVETDSSPEEAGGTPQASGEDEQDVDDAAQEPDLPEPAPESGNYETVSTPSPEKNEGPEDDNSVAEKRQSTIAQIDGTNEDEDEQLQGTPKMAEVAKSSPVATQDADASFATTASQVSETPDTEEAEVASTEKPKRGGRKTRFASSSKSAKSATVSKRGQRQTSSQEIPGLQMTTRSKTMSFQQSSPREGKEDMSIQLARAALKSPPAKTKRKVSATTAKRVTADLIKRLENDMPDCVSLKDLRKYNSRTLDVAAVVTSAHTSPKRTITREYASSFTITDPSLAPDDVVEVDLYSLHRDHLPVVKVGDAVLLRAFTVVSLPGRGFGLKTDKDESSWAVFEADAEDEPQMRAAPVEMNCKETKFLLDLRAWHAGFDDRAREKLANAVGEVIEKGRENRDKK